MHRIYETFEAIFRTIGKLYLLPNTAFCNIFKKKKTQEKTLRANCKTLCTTVLNRVYLFIKFEI